MLQRSDGSGPSSRSPFSSSQTPPPHCIPVHVLCDHRVEETDRWTLLQGWRAEKAGEERRLSTVSAGAGGIVGGVVAVIVKVLGGG